MIKIIYSFSTFILFLFLSLSSVFAQTTTYTLSVTNEPVAGGSITRDKPGPNYIAGDIVKLTATPI
ncbi:MAG: hypothetical protein WCU00_05280, partial [Candidatus Latescibacterota bacterium]